MNSDRPPNRAEQIEPQESDSVDPTHQHSIDAGNDTTAVPRGSLSDTIFREESAADQNLTQDYSSVDSDGTAEFVFDSDATANFASNGTPLARSKTRVEIPGYKILGELGRGAMGVVYKAHQTRADRHVALKVMLHSDHAGSQELARFQIEAQSAARLQHPNIVQIYEVNQVGDTPYFTLEFVEGGTLARKLAKQMLTAEESGKLMLTLCQAMAYAHSKGVIHRDLKPANILVAMDGTPKIADFGLARKTDDVSHLTIDGTVLGTPNYMSPEQASGKQAEIGPLSDVYTLGTILYEMMVGRPPFKGASAWEVIQQVRSAEPAPPSTLQPGIPRDLETICLKCLQKEPDKRYGSAQLLADDLQRFLNNEPILARPIGSVERLVRLCRRYPREARLVGFIAALLVVMAVGATITAYQIGQQRDQIKTQLGVIAVEKDKSDKRLVTYRDTVSQLANQAPSLLNDAPLGAGTREEFLRLISEILDRTDETDAIGPSLQWGKVAIALRQGDLLLTQAAEELKRSDKLEVGQEKIQKADEQFSAAVRLAKEVYEAKPPEKSKAAANYASAVSRQATCAVVSKKPLAEIVPMHKLAIDLRKEALAAALDSANAEETASRKTELGGAQFRYAEYLLMNQANDPVKFATGAKVNALAAIDNLRQAIQELPSSSMNRPRAHQDLGLALKALAFAASRLDLDDEARSAYSESVSVLYDLSQEFPNRYSYRRLLIDAANAYGDYLLNKHAEPSLIEQQYSIALAQLKNTLDAPEFKALQHGTNGLAMQYYRYGLIDLRAGEPAKAKSAFERCALLREIAWNDVWHDGGASSNPDLAISQRIELMLALARCGRTEDALLHVQWLDERARKLFRERKESGKDLRAGGLAPHQLFALVGSAEGLIAEFVPEDDRPAALARAVKSIERAIKTGYRDVTYLRKDPDFAPLQNVEAFQELLESSSGNPSPKP